MAENTFEEIQRIVFATRVGECLSASEWQRLYAEDSRHLPIEHLTSCARCLDTVNRLLGLPLLAERHPFDTINRDSDGPFNSSTDAGNSGSKKSKNQPDNSY